MSNVFRHSHENWSNFKFNVAFYGLTKYLNNKWYMRSFHLLSVFYQYNFLGG